MKRRLLRLRINIFVGGYALVWRRVGDVAEPAAPRRTTHHNRPVQQHINQRLNNINVHRYYLVLGLSANAATLRREHNTRRRRRRRRIDVADAAAGTYHSN